MPDLYIITGSTGAGKSSIGPEYLPLYIRNQYPAQIPSPKEARKLAYEYVSDTFDRLVEESLGRNETFVYKSHFTNDATWCMVDAILNPSGFR